MTDLQKYTALENKISNSTETYFVVRDTDHPVEDLLRNWSSTMGGVNYQGDFAADTLEETENYEGEYRYHPAHEGFCIVDYEGLGAFCLDAENVKEAIIEANEYSERNNLACCGGSGDGCFESHEVVSFHEVRSGRYIFELK